MARGQRASSPTEINPPRGPSSHASRSSNILLPFLHQHSGEKATPRIAQRHKKPFLHSRAGRPRATDGDHSPLFRPTVDAYCPFVFENCISSSNSPTGSPFHCTPLDPLIHRLPHFFFFFLQNPICLLVCSSVSQCHFSNSSRSTSKAIAHCVPHRRGPSAFGREKHFPS